MRRIFQLMLLVTVALMGCDVQESQPSSTVSKDRAVTLDSIADSTMLATAKTPAIRYVAVTGGLRLHDGPEFQSESHVTVGYGLEVEMLDGQPGDSLLKENIPGRMVQVRHGKFEGYVFSGFLSALPMPPSDDHTQRWTYQEGYARSLENQGIPASFEWHETKEGGDHAELRLPASGIHEAFLIARQLFGIPEAYDFPSKPHQVLSTPKDPSPAAEASPYDYVTHEMVAKFLEGQPASMGYTEDTEVGGKTINIWKDGDQWVLQWTGFVH